MSEPTKTPPKMTPCRECGRTVSHNAVACPGCGAPAPANQDWDGSYGYEYKSKTTLFGIPLVHISFKYHFYGKAPRPVVAKGIIAIGQFGIGVVNISQVGVGLCGVGQLMVARWAVAQFAVAHDAICQIGLVTHSGLAQKLFYVNDVMQWLGF